MSSRQVFGQIALLFHANLPIEILEGDVGFYIGTREDGLPFSRESEEYFGTLAQARLALSTGSWTQRQCTYSGAVQRAELPSVSR